MSTRIGRVLDLTALALAPVSPPRTPGRDEHCDSGDGSQGLLGLEYRVRSHTSTPGGIARDISIEVLGRDDHALDAFGEQLLCERWHPDHAIAGWRAGHRYVIVVEAACSDVGPEAIAALIARLPEWAYVPSPMFWMK